MKKRDRCCQNMLTSSPISGQCHKILQIYDTNYAQIRIINKFWVSCMQMFCKKTLGRLWPVLAKHAYLPQISSQQMSPTLLVTSKCVSWGKLRGEEGKGVFGELARYTHLKQSSTDRYTAPCDIRGFKILHPSDTFPKLLPNIGCQQLVVSKLNCKVFLFLEHKNSEGKGVVVRLVKCHISLSCRLAVLSVFVFVCFFAFVFVFEGKSVAGLAKCHLLQLLGDLPSCTLCPAM